MKIYLILFMGLCLWVSDASLLGAKECSYGPTYWCGSLWNARECNAVKHCIQTVWEKQKLPNDKDDVCKLCKKAVKETRTVLPSNPTQDEIHQVFFNSCNKNTIEVVKKECIKFTGILMPELVQTIQSQMKPEAVCSSAGLCNNPWVDRMIRKYEGKVNQISAEDDKKVPEATPVSASAAAESCGDCKTFLNDLIKTVQTHSRAELLDHLLAICGRLGTLSDGCMSLVQINFDDIYNFFTTGLNPQDVCDLFGMCQRMYGDKVVMMPKTGDQPCDFCVAMVDSWKNNLVANTTKEEFKMILDGICKQTRNFESECISLVNEYFDELYEVLVSNIRPKEICEVVGLCGIQSVFNNELPIWTTFGLKPKDHMARVPLQPSIDLDSLVGRDEAASYNIHLPKVPLSKPDIEVVSIGEKGVLTSGKLGGNDQCIMCQFVLHFLQNALNDNSTKEEIKQAVESVCKLFPHKIEEQCEDYIDAYGDQLIQLLILEIDPSQICPMMHLCPGKALSQNSDSSCLMCEFAMTKVDDILKDKTNKESIKAAVDRVCAYFPKSLRADCKSFIDTYIDQIVDLIANEYTPEQICEQLGLCPSKVTQLTPIDDPLSAQLPISRMFIPSIISEPNEDDVSVKVFGENKPSLVCVVCEFIMDKVDSLIMSNSSVTEVEFVMEKVCLLMPTTVKNDCISFLEEYINSIMDLLVNYMQPQFVCREMKLCKANLEEDMFKTQVSFPVDECQVCEEVMQWVDKKEKEGLVINIVDSLISEVCNLFHGKGKNTCFKMVKNYGVVLEKLIEELSDPKRVCQALKMCPYSGMKPLLGAKKCTWGPSYWCQSRVHAEACKATEHCSEKVWGGQEPSI